MMTTGKLPLIKEIDVSWKTGDKTNHMKISAHPSRMMLTRRADECRLIVDGFHHSFVISDEEYGRVLAMV